MNSLFISFHVLPPPMKILILFLVSITLIAIGSHFSPHSSSSTSYSSYSEMKILQDRISELEHQLNSNIKGRVHEEIRDYGLIATSSKTYPNVGRLSAGEQKRILITGGAGFVGSNLVDVLMLRGEYVIVLDNFFTGRKQNVEHWIGHPNFELITHDVVNPYMAEVDQIYHLACPASPPHYQYNPIKTIKTSTQGTLNMLGLAKRVKARILFTSTSEIYGDPEVHPQHEDYWGHVNVMGPRSCYDEGKRVAETMCYSYAKEANVDVRIARIFNTFGPRMHPHDGRVVSNFIIQALQNKPLTVYGGGNQTRSFQFVSDLVHGLIALMNSDTELPVNLGNPQETTILEFAEYIQKKINPAATIEHKVLGKDDPQRRKPDITRAKQLLGWEPQYTTAQGLDVAIEYFKQQLGLSNKTTTIWIA